MFKFIMAISFFIVSSYAMADGYTCNDRNYLRDVLANLSKTCGDSSASLCRAHSFAGSTIESAIKACSSLYGETSCAQNVTCDSGIKVCKAHSFAGSDVESAIKACSILYGATSCAQNVTCNSGVVCKAHSFAGSDVESAVKACATLYGQTSCAQNVTCK